MKQELSFDRQKRSRLLSNEENEEQETLQNQSQEYTNREETNTQGSKTQKKAKIKTVSEALSIVNYFKTSIDKKQGDVMEQRKQLCEEKQVIDSTERNWEQKISKAQNWFYDTIKHGKQSIKYLNKYNKIVEQNIDIQDTEDFQKDENLTKLISSIQKQLKQNGHINCCINNQREINQLLPSLKDCIKKYSEQRKSQKKDLESEDQKEEELEKPEEIQDKKELQGKSDNFVFLSKMISNQIEEAIENGNQFILQKLSEGYKFGQLLIA